MTEQATWDGRAPAAGGRPEELFAALAAAVGQAVLGQRAAVELALAAILAGGHVLLEDQPGTGKTLLAKSLAAATGLPCGRVQCTPDLLPADLLGGPVLTAAGEFAFRPGPVFTTLLLADELNRASPKAQSALLEAMAERRVTSDGVARPLPPFFTVVATQNPMDQAGAYPLPESQLDRFAVRVSLGHPGRDQAVALLGQAGRDDRSALVAQAADAAGLAWLRDQAAAVHTGEAILGYAHDLAAATRADPRCELGASTRGALALVRLAKVVAMADGRDFAIPDDVKGLAIPVLAHRIRLSDQAGFDGVTGQELVAGIVAAVPVPKDSRPGRAR